MAYKHRFGTGWSARRRGYVSQGWRRDLLILGWYEPRRAVADPIDRAAQCLRRAADRVGP